jgi:hypothetical protein
MAKNQGIKSRNLVHKPVRTGAERRHVHPGGVAQLGQKQGNHSTDGNVLANRGQPLFGPNKPISVPLGNEVSARTKAGPGGSRTIYKTGTQCMTGAPDKGNPPPAGNPLAGWERK